MKQEDHGAVTLYNLEPTPDRFRDDLLAGLACRPKQAPCKYLYDKNGAQLFEQICELEEYYLTRTETAILTEQIRAIAERCGPRCCLVELGSGSSTKTRRLLDSLERPAAYIPIDISKRQLIRVATRLSERYPELEILPVCGDYCRPFELPQPKSTANRMVFFFPGSTLGNFEPEDAKAFLARLAAMSRPDDGLLVGIDLRKEPALMERAYRDEKGVTAAFIANLLVRANRELQADFQMEQFCHEAVYVPEAGRVENRLISLCDQEVRIGGTTIHFGKDEPLVVEHSYKFTMEGFRSLAADVGYEVAEVWRDPEQWFSLQYLRRADACPK